MTRPKHDVDMRESLLSRRRLIQGAASGSLITLLGSALYAFSDDLTREAQAAERPDGRARLPPGQRALKRLKPMGGQEGDPSPSNFRLRVYGEVAKPFDVDFGELRKMGEITRSSDVHCVTGWSVLDARWTGVALKDLARRAKPTKRARYVILEAAHGYTANMPMAAALAPAVMIAYRLDGRPLRRAHGSPVRAVVPDLYFWKSAKWITAIRFAQRDEPGYWERRGYHNEADPWREQRHG